MTPPHDFPAAKQVTVVRSGGLKPSRITTVFAADRPPPEGFSAADVAAVLRAAADPALKSAPSTAPTAPCCDQYTYRVTVLYPDSTSLVFSLTQGLDAPQAQEHLVHLVS